MLLDKLKSAIENSLMEFHSQNESWTIKSFDSFIIDRNYADKVAKPKLNPNHTNYIYICFSTDSNEKRITMKEFAEILSKHIGHKYTFIKDTQAKHFFVYFEYHEEHTFKSKLKRDLIINTNE